MGQDAAVGVVERVYNVSDSLLRDCYQIANMTRPSAAMHICQSLRYDIESCHHTLFVFNGPNFPYGFIKGHFFGADTAKIDWLFVDSLYHGRGVGQRLLDAYTDFCRQNKIANITLFSAPNLRTLRFYQRNGFEIAGVNYLMSKNLGR